MADVNFGTGGPNSTPGQEIKPVDRPYTGNAAGRVAEHYRPTRARRKTYRTIAVRLPRDVFNRLTNAMYWLPDMTLQRFTEEAITGALEDLEEKHGGPYPPRRRLRHQKTGTRNQGRVDLLI